MELLLVKFATALSLPPGSNLLLTVTGLLIKRRWRRVGLTLVTLGLVSLYALSTEFVSIALARGLETYPPLSREAIRGHPPGAIVVLAGGRVSNSPEYGADTVSLKTLGRLRFAARLYRETLLPVLVSGGSVYGEDFGEAFLMKESLVDDFKVPVTWSEETSRNTWENAVNSARLLAEDDVRSIILITDAAHMPRSVDAFEAQGLEVFPAPTNFSTRDQKRPLLFSLLPEVGALHASAWYLHEYLGRIWYALRY